jgi:hypothetical protein
MVRDTTAWILRATVGLAVVVLLSTALAARGMAAEWRGHWEGGWHGHEAPHWGHGGIARFHEGDWDRWRAGHWFHGEHFGRLGWWWVVDGAWYFYPVPVYPYPDPYIPPMVAAPAPPPSPQSPPQYWYYCPSMRGYYPYVTECPEGWTPVAPRPAPPG